jgi:UDP-glucose 4-epimerase
MAQAIGTEKILITGVAGYWGARVATRLLVEADYHVIGVDVERPAKEIKELDFVQADVRNPSLADLFNSEGIDTVCHLAFVETVQPGEAAFDANVMGASKIAQACAQAGVRKLVLKSSTAVYGAHPDNSAFLTEDHALRGSRHYGYIRDLIEIEKFFGGFGHERPELMITILRFANIVGPTADTPLARFLGRPASPSLLGFDPMMQIIHEDDVVEALVHAIHTDRPGVFNVSAHDVLPLNKVRGLAGKPPLPIFHPLAYWGARVLGNAGFKFDRLAPIDLDYLRYPCVGDLARMQAELGFVPRYTAEDALREFAEHQRLDRYASGSPGLARDEERLREVIEQRRRARERQAAVVTDEEAGGDHE